MDIEKIATAVVSASISATDYLSSFINEGDKEPSWDGTVYIFNDKRNKKASMKGRVAVQVKGHKTNDLSKSEISFQVERADLENYLNDGGVVFFVVYIPNNDQLPKIYYSSLLPIKLRMLLAECKGSKAIKLQEFPTDNAKKVRLFAGFLDNSVKQASFAKAELLSLDDYENQGVLEGISMTVAGYDIDISDPQKSLFNNEVYMYANIMGCSIPQPLDFMPLGIKTAEEVYSPVTAGGKLYYGKYIRIRSKDTTIIKIGQSTQITIPAGSATGAMVNFETAPMLCDSVHDLDFLLSALDAKQFELGTIPIPLVPKGEERTGFNIDEQRRILTDSKRVLELFNMLGMSTKVEMAKLSADDRLNISRLIKALLDNEPVGGLKDDLSLVLKIELAGSKLALIFQHCDNPNTYTIADFFKTQVMMCVDVDGETQPVSQYALLCKDDFLELANLELSVLLPSYQEIDGNMCLYERANLTLLELLSAYDEAGDSRKDLLDTASGFADWLCSIDMDETSLPRVVRELNRLQVAKRKRSLLKAEVKYLCGIVEDSGQREDIIVGASLLLDNQAAAEIHFEQVPPDYQDEFMTYPIFRFWKKAKEDRQNG